LIKREQLPLPSRYRAPRTPTELRLTAIWATALSLDRVGVDDSYRDLGGDCFLASVIIGMIEESFQWGVPLEFLAEAATVATLATQLDVLSAGRAL
jgi:acyl carrier protein